MRGAGLISLLISVCIIGYVVVQQMGGRKSDGGGGANIKRAEESAQRAAGTANRTLVEAAIRAYQSRHEKNPPDLDALVQEGLIDRVPGGFVYNPETGALEP